MKLLYILVDGDSHCFIINLKADIIFPLQVVFIAKQLKKGSYAFLIHPEAPSSDIPLHIFWSRQVHFFSIPEVQNLVFLCSCKRI